ncbi:MAG: hypothetical protein ABGW97_14740 [Christiangramia sp.]|uniref:hypothetical protein n=1 Tax=Christiangramia sp. TaxID=1931228 RepID=UPI003243002D
MKNLVLFIALILVQSSCKKKSYQIRLEGKWVVYKMKLAGREIQDQLNNQLSTLSFYRNDSIQYPAIRFYDSLFIVPGHQQENYKFRFSINADSTKLTITQNEEITDSVSEKVPSLFLGEFDLKTRRYEQKMELRADSLEITLIESEKYASYSRGNSKLD